MQFRLKNHGQGVSIQSSFAASYWPSSSCADRMVVSCQGYVKDLRKNYVSTCVQFLDHQCDKLTHPHIGQTYSHIYNMHINGAHSYLPNASYILLIMSKRQSRFDAGSPRSGKELKARVYIFKDIRYVPTCV